MATLLRQIALVSETQRVSFSDLTLASAALQKQATRDFAPVWDVQATVDAFARLEDVPLGYWPVIVEDDIQQSGAAGIHLDKDGQPFALVQFDDGWQLTASHESLEMLADPFGNRVVAGDSPKQDQGRVEFLVEVCDPCEAAEFGYTVNGILLSDFYTPAYFDPVQAAGVRYSYTGSITEPRQVLKGGYLSWHDLTSDHWWQEIYFGAQPQFRDLGPLARDGGSLRSQIDRLTNELSRASMLANRGGLHAAARAFAPLVARPSESKARLWRAQIDELKAGATAPAEQPARPEGRRRPPRHGHPGEHSAEGQRAERRRPPRPPEE
jgi:hypothetical protein